MKRMTAAVLVAAAVVGLAIPVVFKLKKKNNTKV